MSDVCYLHYFISMQYLQFKVNNYYVICKRFLYGVIRELEKCTVTQLEEFQREDLYLNQLNLKKDLCYVSVHLLAWDNDLGKVLRILCASEKSNTSLIMTIIDQLMRRSEDNVLRKKEIRATP